MQSPQKGQVLGMWSDADVLAKINSECALCLGCH